MCCKESALKYLALACLLLLYFIPTGVCQQRSFVHYTTNEGLPYSGITDLAEDDEGFIWVATRMSVSLFDGYNFTDVPAFLSDGAEAVTQTPHFVMDIDGRLFIISRSRLFAYYPELGYFEEIPVYIPGLSYMGIVPCHKGGFFINIHGTIEYLHGSLDRLEPISGIGEFKGMFSTEEKCVYIHSNNEHYLYIADSGSAYVYNHRTGRQYIVTMPVPVKPGGFIFFPDDTESFWLSYPDTGLWRIDFKDGTTDFFSNTLADSSKRISHNMVRDIVRDKDGNYWIGTENGINILDPSFGITELIQSAENYPKSLNCNKIYKFLVDSNENIWAGTYFGGLNVWNSEDDFFNTLSAGTGDYFLSGREVRCITEDDFGNIWVGLEGSGVNLIDRESGKITVYRHEPGRNSLSYDNVHDILAGPDSMIYIATFTGGVNIFDPEQEVFTHLKSGDPGGLPSDIAYSLLAVGDSIFIGTSRGVAVWNTRSRKLSQLHPEVLGDKLGDYLHRHGDSIWISARNGIFVYSISGDSISSFDRLAKPLISFITSDSKNNIWIGDNFMGLYRYDTANDSVYHYSPESGFPAKRVFGLIEGREGQHWISSEKGLIKFNYRTGEYVLYGAGSGLPFTQYNYNAYFRDSQDNIYFGGINGLVYFNEDNETGKRAPYEVAFTGFELFNRRLGPEDPQIYGPLNRNRRVVLDYYDNNFSVHFSALDYINPGRIQYAYYLEGFDKDWNYAGNSTKATYTGLRQGKYRLHVKAADENLNWDDKVSVLEIRVMPPFWLSGWAYGIYAMLIGLSLFFFYQYTVRIGKAKALLLVERKEKETQEELGRFKLEFFTNIAHEFRTPLNLIIAPLVKMLKEKKTDDKFWARLENVNTNAGRLLSLINQLMGFRKIELGKEKLCVRQVDIQNFVRDISETFIDLAETMDIDFCYDIEGKRPVWIDPQKTERILFNLISNAIKNTPAGGMISVSVRYTKNKLKNGVMADCAEFWVTDSGKGIAPGDLDRVFDVFHQSSSPYGLYPGSGIGLAYTRNLVSLHKGDIRVQTKPGKGTRFKFWLPVEAGVYSDDEIYSSDNGFKINIDEMIAMEIPHLKSHYDKNTTDKEAVLIVDDDQEILDYLKDLLSENFSVNTARNGSEALELTGSVNPDLIISDIMMPETDGLELTKKIKSDLATSHIPVILLTAKTQIEDQYEGLLTGADAYIEKPFYPHILIQLIDNILSTKRNNIERLKKEDGFSPVEMARSRSDKAFLAELTSIIMQNIDNPDLDVKFLLSGINISRTLLHMKLRKIANCSATGFIRIIRLKEAAALLRSGEYTVSEAAYATGFSSPEFFSKRFREFFGQPPREYLRQLQ